MQNLNKKETRTVSVPIPENELVEIGERASQLHKNMLRLEIDKATYSKKIKLEIEKIQPEFNRLMDLLSDKAIPEEVDLDMHYDPETKEICYLDENGEIVYTREATEEDLQLELA